MTIHQATPPAQGMIVPPKASLLEWGGTRARCSYVHLNIILDQYTTRAAPCAVSSHRMTYRPLATAPRTSCWNNRLGTCRRRRIQSHMLHFAREIHVSINTGKHRSSSTCTDCNRRNRFIRKRPSYVNYTFVIISRS